MAEEWFQSGDTVEVELAFRDGTWYLDDSEVNGETVCLFTDGDGPDERSPQTVSARVKKYRQGVSSDTNYLTLRRLEEDHAPTSTKVHPSSKPKPSKVRNEPNGGVEGSYPERRLTQFRGNGDAVTVEGNIEGIEFVNQNHSKMPALKGVLGERGSAKKVPFVVENGVSHPYFDPGGRFRFVGVIDHKYKRDGEIQALITDTTEILEMD
ncbi:hypothetical protein HSRCO_0477 [Halanaeroarchaeum sp. HSR-CO]|uniref:hypothetical protein n=1 Tax=Halanaeroarchaeum sp. HSR-CO TaxID=2866382 RepID=UPI00217EE569|nr:hypothetical protein [Halanaeroarchaeum sp. HSR-CO]UWG46773.1 hypothetical protein HSRCO_0477 [Halanaeroarchaeum sp. HSR-CO]